MNTYITFCVALLLASASLFAAPDSAQTLDQIPKAKQPLPLAKDWKNPAIVILSDGVHISGIAMPVAINDLLSALASLPKSAWPYGRVITLSAFPGLSGSLVGLKEAQRRETSVRDILKSAGIEIITMGSA